MNNMLLGMVKMPPLNLMNNMLLGMVKMPPLNFTKKVFPVDGQHASPEAQGDPQPPLKHHASKTSKAARGRQRERRQAAKGVIINLTSEEWQEVVDWLLQRWDTTGKNQYIAVAEEFLRCWDLVPPHGNFGAFCRKFADMAESRLRSYC